MVTYAPFGRASRRALVSLVLGAVAAHAIAQSPVGFRSAVDNDVVMENHVTAYGGAGNPAFFQGTYIQSLIGATNIYAAGYTGTRATLANIEGGYAANNNLTTSRTSAYFAGNGALAYNATSVQDHATMVSGMMAGFAPSFANDPTYGNALRGMAYDSRLWSGNIANGFGANGSFSAPVNAIWHAYNQAFAIGVGNNGTASLVNSSWGFSSGTLATMNNISAGRDTRTVAIDSLIQSTHKLLVISAGNGGENTPAPFNHVAGIGAGWNSLTVGSLGTNVIGDAAGSFTQRSSFSSYGPSNYYNPVTGEIVANVRATVDIAAPGEEIVGETKTSGSFSAANGTSFSSPITAGVAGLLIDAALDKGFTNATDSRVMASIIMNAADKNAGWTNNATTVAGVNGTTQGLDWQTGAGKLNAGRAFTQLTTGTTDVAGLGGGLVSANGWDLGAVSDAASTDYILGGLKVGSTFSAMLRWDAGFSTTSTATTLTGANYDYLSNLRLELLADGQLVAFSDSLYNNTEHINFTVGRLGAYTMRVRFIGENYDFVNHANAETYGLAWRGTVGAVPEPASMVALGLGVAAFVRRRKKA